MVCPNCGFNNTDNTTKCLICQADLQNSQSVINTNIDTGNNPNYYEENTKKKFNILPIILIIIAVIVIGVGIILFVFYNNKPKYTTNVTFGTDSITTLYGIYSNIEVQNEMPCGDTCLNIYYDRLNYTDNVNKEYETSLKNNQFKIYAVKNSNTLKITKFIRSSTINGRVLIVTITINSQNSTIKYEQIIGSIEDQIEKELQ